jgi:hypothetical protein
MYLCQKLGVHRLAEIMRPFDLPNIGSVSSITTLSLTWYYNMVLLVGEAKAPEDSRADLQTAD